MDNMDLQIAIRDSEWWRQAKAMPDRHYDESAGISLADHLEAVLRNLRLLRPFGGRHEYFAQLQVTLEMAGLDPESLYSLLTPVALLHDIGKTREVIGEEGEHPLTGEIVRMRHPVLGLVAALELLPADLPWRETILALIEEHSTPYAWFNEFRKTQQVPKPKSWSKLDRKLDPRDDGTGLIMLSLFKLADIDGHEDVADVSWFIENANENCLREKGKLLPVPTRGATESLEVAAE